MTMAVDDLFDSDDHENGELRDIVKGRLEELQRIDDNEKIFIPVAREQWAVDAVGDIYGKLHAHSRSSIRTALVDIGYNSSRNLMKEIEEINQLQRLFKQFIKSHSPDRENSNKISKQIDDITDIKIQKADPDTNYNSQDSMGILREKGAKVGDEAKQSALSKSDIVRVLEAEGILHSKTVSDSDKEMATKYVINAEEAVDEARHELEKKIASYIGRNICYIKKHIIDGMNVTAVAELNELYELMQTEWQDSVGWHIDKITD